MSENTETTTLEEAKAKNAPFSSPWLHLSQRHGLSETAETIALIIPLGVHSLGNRHTHTHTHLSLPRGLFWTVTGGVESEDNTLLTAHQVGEGDQKVGLKLERGTLITVAQGSTTSKKLLIQVFYR